MSNENSTSNGSLPLFDIEEFNLFDYTYFLNSEIGKLWQSIPFDALSECYPAKDKSKGGRTENFCIRGKLACLVLKHHTGLSDERLIERINTDVSFRLFCFRPLNRQKVIEDKGAVSKARGFLASSLDIQKMQKAVVPHWVPFLSHIGINLQDAVCYESYIKFPTDVKLLWDCCEWVGENVRTLCKVLKVRTPRSKYLDQKKQQQAFAKMKKKTYKQTRKRKRKLLYLLTKLTGQLQEILNRHPEVHQTLDKKFYDHLKTIRTVRIQQKYMYDHKVNKVGNRIVSFYKPYIRPIKRGKENKPTEFGCKVQMGQCDGINFIDRLDFNAFNECTELKRSVWKHRHRFGRCTHVGADRIYGTNTNRKFLTEPGIHHSLPQKGRVKAAHAEQRKQMAQALGKQRATVLEGSFGNEKNHYGLRKVKARTQATEIAWVFFVPQLLRDKCCQNS